MRASARIPTRNNFDVVVIGGGPAGSTTAFHLASCGARIAVIDRAAFPREKVCGDLLTNSALECLAHMGLVELFRSRPAPMKWSASFDTHGDQDKSFEYPVLRRNGIPQCVTIPRFELDAALLAHAQQAGAVVYERVTAEAASVEDDGVHLNVSGLDGGELIARLLIVAQGSVGKFIRHQPGFFALRGYYEPLSISPTPITLRFEADLSPGYEWQFLVGELHNIGIYTSAARAYAMRIDHRLDRSSLVRGKKRLGRLRGAWLNTSFDKVPAHADRVLWVGDAAGLAFSYTGEGIYPALRSGEIAAECALDALKTDCLTREELAVYSRRLHTVFDGQRRLSRLFSWCMQRPHLFRVAGQWLASNVDLIHDLFMRPARVLPSAASVFPGERS